MDEFRKPYEYEDEKGVSGLLLVFFVMLIAFETFLGIIAAFSGYDTVKSIPGLGKLYIGLGIFFVVYPLFTAFALRKMKKYAVRIAKIYLIARLVYHIPFVVVNTIIMINRISYNKDYIEYGKEYNSLIIGLAISLFYLVAFSVLWYLYFSRSKKVREFYPGKGKAA